MQQQAKRRQNLRGRLEDAGHQQEFAHLMPPPVLRRVHATFMYKHKRDPGATVPKVPLGG
jgi:hypothetical protein